MTENGTRSLMPSRNEMERAFAGRNASYDGVFYVAVQTTGIFCRPSCSSRPKPENVEFFGSIKECLQAGYRPCKRCSPMEATGAPPDWIVRLMARVESAPDAPLKSADLQALGVTPERVRRWFQAHYGMSFAAWCRGHRLASAYRQIRAGAQPDEVILESGFESHSGFRDAFVRTFGEAPGRSRQSGDCIVTALIESPLGPLLAAATDDGICLLDFIDREFMSSQFERARKRFECPVVPGEHQWLAQLKRELGEYFSAERKEFDVPLATKGSAFQEKVWRELRCIPYGETISYEDLARRIGQPTAQRAVASANRLNHVCILIPCHRVIGKDGSLTGYGGGLWRKRLLLELERSGRLPS